MKFIVDAQLPKSLTRLLAELGHDAIHTLDMPERNATDDIAICELSIEEKRVVVSKDSDFYDRFFQKLEPYKLLYVSTGNITNQHLLNLIRMNMDVISEQLAFHFVVEIDQSNIITID